MWLVKFIDLSEWHKYTIYLWHADIFLGAFRCDQEKQRPSSLLEHHLATNLLLANLENMDNIKLFQVLWIMALMGPTQRQAHIKPLYAQLTPVLLLYKILKDKGLYMAAMKLLTWKHFYGTTVGTGIMAGLLSSWAPVYGGVSQFIFCCM